MIVYKATNISNGKIYIGKTIRTLSHAKARHHQRARFAWKYGTQSRFYSAIRKYGEENFSWEIIFVGNSDEDIQAAERRYIAELKSYDKSLGYNMTPGGDGGAGKTLSSQHKQKLRIAFSGQRNPMAGKTGKDHPAYGHKKSPEQKALISAAHLGRPKSDQQRILLSIAKKKTSRFSDQDYLKMRALYEQGHGSYHIGETFSCQPSVVLKILAREFPGLERREKSTSSQRKRNAFVEKRDSGAYKGEKAGPSKVSDKDRAEMCIRRANGDSYGTIADAYPIGLTGVRAIIKDWGPPNGFPFMKMIAPKKRNK
jgi:group I intron endonuclease